MTSADEEECPGKGLCHGCLKWCSTCGDVAHVCDTRLRGERCDEHPVPPPWPSLRRARAAVEQQAYEARRALQQAERDLQDLVDQENARRAYNAQLREEDRRLFAPEQDQGGAG